MKKTIEKAINQFERLKDSRYILKHEPDDRLHEVLLKVIREADTDVNNAYKWTLEALEAIDEILANTEDIEEIEESLKEYADSYTPVYNDKLLNWLVASLENVSNVEEAITEYGCLDNEGNFSLMNKIMAGYALAWERHALEVLNAIKNYQKGEK